MEGEGEGEGAVCWMGDTSTFQSQNRNNRQQPKDIASNVMIHYLFEMIHIITIN